MPIRACLEAVLPAAAVGLALSCLLEGRLRPRPRPFRQRPAAAAIHAGLWLLLFCAELLLFHRPWFAMANVACLQLLLVLVSNAKFAVLREPFIFQDFEYFTDAIRHPRLYLPFFGLGNALLAAVAFISALLAGLSLEISLLTRFALPVCLITLATLLLAALGLLRLGAKHSPPAGFEPEADLRRLGLAASLWRYAEAEAGPCRSLSIYNRPHAPPDDGRPLPCLVAVQSESFFDVRDHYPGINPHVLAAYDGLKAEAPCYGKLRTPAWGANTVRTEFGFLSGISGAELGVHRFNPYRKFARRQPGNLTGFLKSLGYRTVCVHPYPAGFYARDKVFPLLGFDEFIDIRGFANSDKSGPFVGDAAVAEKICALLAARGPQPLFVFAITMENHGPLHLENLHPADGLFHDSPPPAGCNDLSVYLRHLKNADRMAARLREALSGLAGENWLCWYGDHVPIMADVYATLGMPDGRTDYLIWHSGAPAGGPEQAELGVEDLGRLLLQRMGLI
ncbi:MAG: LTA synthase family protein [Methylococcales bacterium]|nr:LTA synthase family protein [Methylococcales bacterium]